MLPPEHRLRRSADFADVVRRGRRASRPTLTVHLLVGDPGSTEPCRAGLVVSKAVGGSVVRHRASRRLRHLLRTTTGAAAGTTTNAAAGTTTGTAAGTTTGTAAPTLPAGSRLVVRASARAGTADSAVLGADLAAALDAALRRGPVAP